ncbi:MAG: hydrogenase maturation protease [Gemmatimonadetes bacterium]|nr:hydrogenase maturation protease [Gemmatimonadota bacterium]
MLVIGVGNEIRGDDAAGLLVARRIRERNPSLSVIESSADPMTLMEAWSEESEVVLIDAVESGGTPGELHRHEAHERALPVDFFHCSTHSFGVAEAVEFARNLDRLPSRLTVFGIEGRSFSAGGDVSESVLSAIESLARAILEECETGESDA